MNPVFILLSKIGRELDPTLMTTMDWFRLFQNAVVELLSHSLQVDSIMGIMDMDTFECCIKFRASDDVFIFGGPRQDSQHQYSINMHVWVLEKFSLHLFNVQANKSTSCMWIVYLPSQLLHELLLLGRNILQTIPSNLPARLIRRKRKAAPGEPCIHTRHYRAAGYVKYVPRLSFLGKRVSLGEYHTREDAAMVYWVAAYYYGSVLDEDIPFNVTPFPKIPPRLSGKERICWIKTQAKAWAASRSLVPRAQPPTLSTGRVNCAVSASFISPTDANLPPSNSVQQDLDYLLQMSPCQLTENNSMTFQRILQDFENTLDDEDNNNNHPMTNAPEHASTGQVKELAHCNGYLLLAPPGARADHICTPTIVSAFKEFTIQGWEVSFNRRGPHMYYFIREPTASHDHDAPALQCSFTTISAFAEFQSQDWTVKFLDSSTGLVITADQQYSILPSSVP